MKTMKMLRVTWLFVLLGWFGGTGVALAGPIIYNVPGAFGWEYPELRMVNADGTGDQRVPVSPELVFGADQPTWSRDRKSIAATGVIGGTTLTGYVGQYQTNSGTVTVLSQYGVQTNAKVLYVFSPATSQVLVPVGVPGGPNTPATYETMYTAFSPDGKQVAYANLQLNNVDFGIVTLNGQPLQASPGVTLLTNPTVIPLGLANNTEGLSGLGIDWSPIAGSNLLVVSYADPYYPASCPSSFNATDALANSLLGMPLGWNTNPTAPANPTRLYSVPAVFNGLSKARPLTNPPVTCMGQIAGDLFPAFSNDGSKIAFVRLPGDGTAHILVIPASGCWPVEAGCAKEIAYAPRLAYAPSPITRVGWSPDDSQLLFDYGSSLWKVNVNGSGITRFIGPVPGAYDAAWSR